MLVVYNPNCSKCAQLGQAIEESGASWTRLHYLEGELTADLVHSIFDGYQGPVRDLIRSKEPEWVVGGLDPRGTAREELEAFVLEHPVVLQRPLVLVNGRVEVARSPEAVQEILSRLGPSALDE